MGNEQSRGLSRGDEELPAELVKRREAAKKRILERHHKRKSTPEPPRGVANDTSNSVFPTQGSTQPSINLRHVPYRQHSTGTAGRSPASAPKETEAPLIQPASLPLRKTNETPSSHSSGQVQSSTGRDSTVQKRPSSANHSIAPLPKIPKRTSAASPNAPYRAETDSPLKWVGDERPPIWYRELKVKNSRGKDQGDTDILLKSLRTQITKCQQNPFPHKLQLAAFAEVRNRLHSLVFREVNASMLKLNRILHNDEGLPQLFDEQYTNGVDWPFDIRADAHELYNKWSRRVFDTHLLRGIKLGLVGNKKDGQKATDSIDPDYPTIPSKYHGNGDLLNGAWWPTQLCALRDGAHGVSQGGISGRVGEGAYSCIMSGGHSYPDIDNGNEVLYCGTDSTDGNVTEYTQRMIESAEGDQPVRLIRSHNLNSEFAPDHGFRYDGLYDVVSFEQLDDPDSTRQRHRFRLVRQPNQDPIRGGAGPERRPTEQEIAEYKKHQRNAGKTKGKT